MKTIVVHFSGVILKNNEQLTMESSPTPHAIEWLHSMIPHFNIKILVGRKNLAEATKWLQKQEDDYMSNLETNCQPLPEYRITKNTTITDKGYGGDIFIYDKCIKFNGNFPSREFVNNFKAWNES